MINRQQSLPSEFVIHIKVTEEKPKKADDSASPYPIPPKTHSIVAKITDPVSSVFDAINSTNRQAKLIFNGQVLCPTLTFAFYNIHNNDTIRIVSSPITASLSSIDLIPNIPLKDSSSNRQVLFAAPRPIPISHRTRIDSSAKSFKKFGPQYNNTADAGPVRRLPSQTPPPPKCLIPRGNPPKPPKPPKPILKNNNDSEKDEEQKDKSSDDQEEKEIDHKTENVETTDDKEEIIMPEKAPETVEMTEV